MPTTESQEVFKWAVAAGLCEESYTPTEADLVQWAFEGLLDSQELDVKPMLRLVPPLAMPAAPTPTEADAPPRRRRRRRRKAVILAPLAEA